MRHYETAAKAERGHHAVLLAGNECEGDCTVSGDCTIHRTAEYILNHDAFSYIPFQDAGEFTYGFASLTEFTQPMKKLIRQFEQDKVQ